MVSNAPVRPGVTTTVSSIAAKATRDRMMERVGGAHPAFGPTCGPTCGLEVHAGYGTAKHRTAIEAESPVPGLHRYTFAPIKGRYGIG